MMTMLIRTDFGLYYFMILSAKYNHRSVLVWEIPELLNLRSDQW